MCSCAPLSKRTNLQLDCPHHSLQELLKGKLAACLSQLTVMTHFPGIFQGRDTMRTRACVCSDAVIPGGFTRLWMAVNTAMVVYFFTKQGPGFK